jgi:Leucine-rich repeat (LRR) protein
LNRLETLNLNGNLLASLKLPAGLTHLTGLFLTANQLASLTLPADLAQLSTLAFLSNPLATLVLSETLAASSNLTINLSQTVATLPGQGVSVFIYPQVIQLARIHQPIGAFQFAVLGPPGVYAILGSANLAGWTELGRVTNTLGAIVFTDTTAHLSPRKFYRARLAP